MTQRNEVYKCTVCGNIVEVNHASGGNLVCCGKPMELLKENTVDASHEKHVPLIEKTSNGYLVKVGSVPHPMESAHFIEWIELIADNISYKHFLKPGDKPEAEFCVKANTITAREYCNLHGLWSKK
jgi:superoxide reductase